MTGVQTCALPILITFNLGAVLNLHSLLVDEISVVCTDVRVVDHHETALGCCNLGIKSLHFLDWESISVEHEVLKILRVVEVRPKDVNWESIVGELCISFHHQVSTRLLILAIVVAETVYRWKRCIPCQLRKDHLVLLGSLSSAENEELELASN